MKLYEYLAKDIFRGAGIPVPAGRPCQAPDEAARAAAEIGPVAIKAQILAGARGKAGGIAFADTPEEAREAAARLLGSELRGYRVDRLLVEEKLIIEKELYLGMAVEGSARRPLVIASGQGGMAIEEVPERAIVKKTLDITWGMQPYTARVLARRLGLEGSLARQFEDIALRVWGVFRRYDAELVEINPLAVAAGRRLVAADARLNVDDEALYRHRDLPRVEEGTDLERRVRELGLSFVQLEGDIAVMANGAGITMATLDVLARYGGRPANFLDAGGGAAAEPTAQAIGVLLETHPRVILINIFGGITRCDEVARAIVKVKSERGLPVPLVVRLVGTNEEQGTALLRDHGIAAFRQMEEAAARAVAIARGGDS
ncbi:MAG: ADP-forming succinate--CoA ligase subunit beta [Bacillota bacterium]|nr:ADP-forming succinate--CoA ligase subunit beta [Bacillota bacterium]